MSSYWKRRLKNYSSLLLLISLINSFSLSQPYVIVEEGIASTRLLPNILLSIISLVVIAIIFDIFSKGNVIAKIYEKVKKK